MVISRRRAVVGLVVVMIAVTAPLRPAPALAGLAAGPIRADVAGIAEVQSGPQVGPIQGPLTAISLSLPAPSLPGTLLVASLASNTWGPGQCRSEAQFTAPLGWARAASVINTAVGLGTEIWYYPNNPGGITTASFGRGCPAPAFWSLNGVVSEWNGVAASGPVDASNAATTVTVRTLSDTISATSSMSGDLALSAWCASEVANGAVTFAPGAGWANLGSDESITDHANHVTFDQAVGGGPGTVGETEAVSAPAYWTGAIVLFLPAGAAATSAPTASAAPSAPSRTVTQNPLPTQTVPSPTSAPSRGDTTGIPPVVGADPASPGSGAHPSPNHPGVSAALPGGGVLIARTAISHDPATSFPSFAQTDPGLIASLPLTRHPVAWGLALAVTLLVFALYVNRRSDFLSGLVAREARS